MKKLLLGLCLVAGVKSFAIFNTIKGNGNIKTETRNASGYTELASGGIMDVTVSYGNSNTITVETDENILPYIETTVDDGKLTIKVKNYESLKPTQGVRVHVSMTKINSISQSGSGSISGSGNFSNDGETNFSMSGSGSMDFAFASVRAAEVHTSGSGSIKLKGTIGSSLQVSQSGSGKVDCEDAPCETVEAHISGSGNAKVNVSKSITARISGSGRVYYKGNPSQIDKSVSGSGGIEKI